MINKLRRVKRFYLNQKDQPLPWERENYLFRVNSGEEETHQVYHLKTGISWVGPGSKKKNRFSNLDELMSYYERKAKRIAREIAKRNLTIPPKQ